MNKIDLYKLNKKTIDKIKYMERIKRAKLTAKAIKEWGTKGE